MSDTKLLLEIINICKDNHIKSIKFDQIEITFKDGASSHNSMTQDLSKILDKFPSDDELLFHSSGELEPDQHVDPLTKEIEQ